MSQLVITQKGRAKMRLVGSLCRKNGGFCRKWQPFPSSPILNNQAQIPPYLDDMQYQNPFHALGLNPEDAHSRQPEWLQARKKEWLAEWEASHDGQVQPGPLALDRNQLIALIDELQQADRRDFHARIYAQPSLLHFLEEASLDYFYEGDISLLPAAGADFLRFLGPYFAHAYNLRLVHAFRQGDREELQVLCQHPLPLPAAYQAAAYKDTAQLLHEKRLAVDAWVLRLEDGHAPAGDIQELGDEWLLQAMNLLPEYFQGQRNSYAESLEQLALSLYRRHKRPKLAILVLRQALKLDISPSIHRRIQELQDNLYQLHPEEQIKHWLGADGEQDRDTWWVALGLGAVGIAAWLLYRWGK